MYLSLSVQYRAPDVPASPLAARAAPADAVVHVAGDIDLLSGPCLQEGLRGFARASGATVLLDLSDVTFIDCSGLRALLAACEEAERRTCPVRITAVSRQVRRLAELTGTWDCFPLAELARGREGARLAVLPVLYGAILPQHGTVLPRYGDLPSRAEPVAGQCRG